MGPDEPPVVVLADPIEPGAVEALSQAPCRVVDASRDPSELDRQLPRAWGLIVRSRTKVTKELIGRAPRLAFVARAGVGVDNVDLPAATARGIRVVNSPAAATASVAELTVALVLLLVRGLYPRIVRTKGGDWQRGENGGELSGKTVGFVGYGRIAREVARRLEPFDVPTLAFDPYVPKEVDRTRLLPLDELLPRSDVVSLHAALTPENRHLIDARRLAQMKPGAFLVNVARGALVDEAALLEALDSGHLAGAALDVFDPEPPKRPKLLDHPKLLATPHLGASTREAQSRAGAWVVGQTVKALTGAPLESLVNPEVERRP